MRTRCLSIHAAYQCRHRGACCQAAWDIDVEAHIVQVLTSGRINPPSATPVYFVPGVDDPSGMSLARTADGWCGFRRESRCSLQQAGGEAMLPSACRHFPRVILRDARGALLTLSHFCPTAAGMLLQDQPVTIVEAAPPLVVAEPMEGLDARDALPPLVRPGLLADIEGYGAWEEAVVREFAASPSVPLALARIAAATEIVRQWRPGRGGLVTAVAKGFETATPESHGIELSEAFGVIREVTGPHPLLTVEDGFAASWRDLETRAGGMLRRPMANYMAACTFGNWTAYRGQGLRTIVAWLQGCFDVLRVQLVRHVEEAGGLDDAVLIESFRMADFILVHTVPSIDFGRAAAVFEQDAAPARVGRP